MGLLPRVSGRLVFRGREIASAGQFLDYRRRIALVLQEPWLFDATVYGNVASGLKLRGLPRREVKARTAVIASFGIGAVRLLAVQQKFNPRFGV
jgi:tungstate transport system ATP-binding protein